MKIRLVSPCELTKEQKDDWCRLLGENPDLDSPFFHPDYTLAVASVRHGIEIAVIEESDKSAGFFPFHRDWFDVGKPVGGPFSDLQGVITRRYTAFSLVDLVRRCGLKGLDFRKGVLTSQESFRPYFRSIGSYFQIDVSGGYEGYEARRRASGSKRIKYLREAVRRIERDLGPVRFEAQSKDKDVLKTLFKWKSDQYRRSCLRDTLRIPWIVAMFNRIHDISGEGFGGILSALYVGDRVAAAHLGMRSRCVWHWWLPSYDRALSYYSPGQVLLLQMIRSAQSLGIERIDDNPNRFFRTGSMPIGRGSVELPGLINMVRRRGFDIKTNLVSQIRASFLRRPAHALNAVYRRVADPLHL